MRFYNKPITVYPTVKQYIFVEAFYKPVGVSLESIDLEEIRNQMVKDGWNDTLSVEFFEDGVSIVGDNEQNEVESEFMDGLLDRDGVIEMLDESIPEFLKLDELWLSTDDEDDIREKAEPYEDYDDIEDDVD